MVLKNKRKGALINNVNRNLKVVRVVSDAPFQNDEAVGLIHVQDLKR